MEAPDGHQAAFIPAARPAAALPVPNGAPRPAGTRVDTLVHALEGRVTGGLSMTGLGLAFLDWGVHLANAPSRRAELARSAAIQWMRLQSAAAGETVIAPPPSDRRFSGPGWAQPPFNLFAQGFLLAQEWWGQTTEGLPGISRANQRLVAFTIRQLADMVSPSNVAWLNPEVVQATAQSLGGNFAAGAMNLLTDLEETVTGAAWGPDSGSASASTWRRPPARWCSATR